MDFDVTSRSASMNTVWWAEGSTDEQEVYDALVAATPIRYGRLIKSRIKPRHLGGGKWLADIDYGTGDSNSAPGVTPSEPQEPGQDDPLDPTQPDPSLPSGVSLQTFELGFELTGGTQKITQSILTRHAVRKGGGVAANHKRAIGVGKDGSVEGCEIHAPKMDISLGVTIPSAWVTMAYVRRLARFVAKTNDRKFWTYAAGELLYLGASGQFIGDGKWKIGHRFAAGENLEGNDPRLSICPGLVLPSKKAWDYIWVSYTDEFDAAAGTLTQVPLDA